MALTLAEPVATLDPDALDVPAEGTALRSAGSLVPVALPGKPGQRTMTAWAVTQHAVARTILGDDELFVKNPQAWHAYRDGLIPEDWPLKKVVTAGTMLNADGVDHRRLRLVVGNAFSRSRVRGLRPRVEETAHRLLDVLAAAAPGEPVDLRAEYAFRLPMEVICELFGLADTSARDRLAGDCGRLLNSHTTTQELLAAQAGILEVITGLIALKRRAPGDDLTTALIRARDDEDGLSEQELIETLFLMLIAGHETTQNLITNAVLNLLEHPGQLALVRAGAVGYGAAVEETFRYDSPLNTLMFRYAVRDVEIAGVTVREGEPVLFCLAAIGRDPQLLPDADTFRVDRVPEDVKHLAFSHGAHYCLGAPLARLEAEIALRALFERYDVSAAAARTALPRVPSLSTHSVAELPVLLTTPVLL